jgi:hypothetical protein
MKVNNYLVTGANLATMGYTQKPGTTPPLDGSIMNKGEASANYYIDPNATPWSTYPDTRAPKYQDFPCPCVGDVTIYNDLEGGFDQTVSYEDCSGNEKYIFVAFGTAVAIQGCVTQDPGGYTGCGVLRGSVIGANLRDVVYGTCCPGFTPCTPPPPPNQCNYNGLNIVCNTVSTATLSWSFTKDGGVLGNMDLYVNGSIVESRSSNSSGLYTVNVGDAINVEIYASGCDFAATKANAYTFDIIADASCGDGSTNLFTGNYIVTAGDVGTTLSLRTFAACDTACI